jgi:hypothetical protein
MKRHILLIALLVVTSTSFAQSKPSFVFKGGYASSAIRGEAMNSFNNLLDYTGGKVSTSNRSGFFAGGNVHIPVTRSFAIEPGIYYAQKGYEMKGSIGLKSIEFVGADARAQLTSHYIDVPVLAKATIGGLQIFAGPQISYLSQADLRTTAGIMGFNLLNKKMDATEQFNRWDVGVTGGVGYQFNNGVNLSATYDHGLSRADANKNFEAYNQSFKIGFGYRF